MQQQLVVVGQVHHVQPQSACDVHADGGVPGRVEQEQLGAGHERRPDEGLAAGVAIIAVHDDEPRPHATQRSTRDFVRLRKVWLMSGELDSGAQEGGGEGVCRKDQYIETAQRVVPARGRGVGAGIGIVVASKSETIHAADGQTLGP